ncbi:hypothetical protein ES703_93566 [subsurface metagenome]
MAIAPSLSIPAGGEDTVTVAVQVLDAPSSSVTVKVTVYVVGAGNE